MRQKKKKEKQNKRKDISTRGGVNYEKNPCRFAGIGKKR